MKKIEAVKLSKWNVFKMVELNVKYLNELIDFIQKNTEAAYKLYLNLEDKPELAKIERDSLEKVYNEVTEKIGNYFGHYKEANEDTKDAYLNAWLYDNYNIDKLNLISWFLEEKKPEADAEGE